MILYEQYYSIIDWCGMFHEKIEKATNEETNANEEASSEFSDVVK